MVFLPVAFAEYIKASARFINSSAESGASLQITTPMLQVTGQLLRTITV